MAFAFNQAEFEGVEFKPLDQLTLRARLYPASKRRPAIIMNPGYNCTKEISAPSAATYFPRHGTTALIYDLRNCGQSEGTPRREIDPHKQIGIWGISFSASIALAAACYDPRAQCVITVADGFEAQWQTNYLSHWALTSHFLGILSRSLDEEGGGTGAVRVINVTRQGRTVVALRNEQVGNILHAKQLNKLFGPEGTEKRGIWTAAVHPGHLDTNLNKQTAFPKFVNTLLKAVGAYLHAIEGAYTSIFAVASSDFKASDSGEYFVPGQKRKQPSKVARDMELAGRLWKWIEDEMRKRKLLG
ncbi:Alpha/Beta hydrolase protein [Aspergillus pseudoustus]|uniref:Alpha/Beta hydrolase protein n=1 Tax=Aspergillus pseudoustus TaxID=1810923 RepID=A0ABR4J0S5_9EURO